MLAQAQQTALSLEGATQQASSLRDLAIVLVQAGLWEEAQQTALAIANAKEKADALCALVDRLAEGHEYARLLTVIQQAWRAATTRDEALDLLPLANSLIVLKPELAGTICDSFAWVKTVLE